MRSPLLLALLFLSLPLILTQYTSEQQPTDPSLPLVTQSPTTPSYTPPW